MDKIPEEMLHEILASALQVDAQFEDVHHGSPFSEFCYYEPSSSILLVCKRWLRVATPLFYNTVVLRSKAQAQALARTLQEHPSLGKYIRKFRVEGGYGANVTRIVDVAPRITHLCISTDVSHKDPSGGICKALNSLNPRCLVLHEPHHVPVDNVQSQALRQKLYQCIKMWTNLRVFHIPTSGRVGMHKYNELLEALRESPNLEIVSYELYSSLQIPILLELAKIPKLKIIQMRSRTFIDLVPSSNTSSRALLQWPAEERPAISKSFLSVPTDPTFAPMSNAPNQVREQIWSRILMFAIEPYHEIDFYHPPSNHNLRQNFVLRRQIGLVSKMFKRLATPYLFESPYIYGDRALKTFTGRLRSNPALGSFIRTLTLTGMKSTSSSEEQTHDILLRAPHLTCLQTIPAYRTSVVNGEITWAGFLTLARVSGSTLLKMHEIYVVAPPLPQSPVVWNHFRSLTSLDWKSPVRFTDRQEDILPDCLPSLVYIRFLLVDPSFLQILAYMDLPSLSHVVIDSKIVCGTLPFFEKHGAKIQELELAAFENFPLFDFCSVLTTLTLKSLSMPLLNPQWYRCQSQHQHLRKIIITFKYDRSCRKGVKTDRRRSQFLRAVDLSPFSALREIHLDNVHWPTREFEILKHLASQDAEFIHNAWNVDTFDTSGLRWKPRLKRITKLAHRLCSFDFL